MSKIYVDIDDFRKNAYYADTDIDIGVYLAEHGCVDVVEVVRCRDCIFARLEDCKIKCYHTYGLLVSKETDYCSYGKRRAEE